MVQPCRRPLILLPLLWLAIAHAQETPLRLFKGAWFDIKYPQTFTVKPRQKSASGQGYDAVSFLSPDAKAEFYVFSPQWNGTPQWVAKQPGEKTAAYLKQKSGGKVTIYVTLQGKGYSRSYVDIQEPELNVRHVFGFKYADKVTYNKYRPLYLKFKESLQQYAD